jgi:hypothetical protein
MRKTVPGTDLHHRNFKPLPITPLMKHATNSILLTLFLISTVSELCLSQNTWTVSNDPSFSADFTIVQDAVASASAGDKIYVYGSATQYNGFTVDKKLHMIGSGYWKTENMIMDQNTNHTRISPNISLLPGSDGSIIEGFFVADDIIIDADTIICRYNRLNEARFMNIPNICLFYGNYLLTDGSAPITGSATGTEIRNNIMKRNQ